MGGRQKKDHANLGENCVCVLWEQEKHRGESKNNGFSTADARKHWASHHLICLCATGSYRGQKNKVLDDTVCMTDWNVNVAPNMIGLPKKLWYKDQYKVGKFYPRNLPAHDIDHGSTGGYTAEVCNYLKTEIWNNFSPSEPDDKKHEKDAEALKAQLEETSSEFESRLLDRGARNSGTEHSWKTRFDDNRDKDARLKAYGGRKGNPITTALTKANMWYLPFSMGKSPKPRSPGIESGKLTNIFNSDFWK